MTEVNYKVPMTRDIAHFYATGRFEIANFFISTFIQEQGSDGDSEYWWLIFAGLLETADLRGYNYL